MRVVEGSGERRRKKEKRGEGWEGGRETELEERKEKEN